MSYSFRIAQLMSEILTGKYAIDPELLGDLEAWVEVPREKTHGDFAFPCFQLAKLLRKSPVAIAAELAEPVGQKLTGDKELSSVQLMGPYLNFTVNKAALAAQLVPGILTGDFLSPRTDAAEKVMIEYSQPNTHKAFHVGHTRNAALGDALVRIFEWCGHETIAANYIGDEGAHIAKCLWYFQNYFHGEIPDSNRGEFLGDLYTKATEMLDFTRLTRCPLAHVVSAEVLELAPNPGVEKQSIVTVHNGVGPRRVICAGQGFRVGDMVAYAEEGARINGRLIGVIEKDGVTSQGMICSESELGLSSETQKIQVLPPGTPRGVALAEFYRIEGALDPGVTVLDEMRHRAQGVAETLRKLEKKDPEVHELWLRTRQWSLDEFHLIYEWLGCRFDHYFYESEVGDTGKNIVLEFYEKGIFVKSEGAIGADLSDAGLPFFLLLKSDGAGLYATKDLALAREKFANFHIDRSVYVVDVSQSLHFQQVFKSLELMGERNASQCYHLAYGLVVLPEGKMSSRAGNIILFSELRRRLDERIVAEFLEKYRGVWPDEEIVEASQRIAVATIRYGMLNQDNVRNIIFDLDEWTARSGNTGPYLLYAYARTRSILREVGTLREDLADWSLLAHETEEHLLNQMSKFEETVRRACTEYRPNLICQYLYSLAKDFSRMYDHCSVIRAEHEALKVTRALLVDAFGRLMKQGLALLGIPTLERM